MKISQLSKQANCKIETIRYYEKIGLLPAPLRSDNGYRIYEDSHVRRLLFIRRSRKLGFSIEEIRALLGLVDGASYSCKDIKSIADEHINDIKQKIKDLKKLEKTLSSIAAQCSGDATPDCPIIESLFDKASK